MIFKKYADDISNLQSEIAFLRIIAVVLGFLVILIGLIALKDINREKTIIVPPNIRHTFWISNEGVSSDYIEQMAYWYAGLILNATPNSSSYQDKLFLEYVDSGVYNSIQTKIKKHENYLHKDNISTIFAVNIVKVDIQRNLVVLSGMLSSWLADKKISDVNVNYVVGFVNKEGILYVNKFKKTSDQDIFGDSTTDTE